MSAKVIAFLNFKGGVGKTANVVNLGACLAYQKHKRVLVVDLDPQCNSTFWLLSPQRFTELTAVARQASAIQRTTFQIFQDAITGTSLFNAHDAIVQGVPRTQNGLELIPNLHLLPSAIDLFDIEFGINPKIVGRVRPSLRNALLPVMEEYDYILLDCPPNIYHVAQTAVVAADHIVVPYNPDYLSLSGLQILCRQLHKMNESFQASRAHLSQNQVCAITVNRYQIVGEIYSTAIAELKAQLLLLKEKGWVHPQCAVLAPPVRLDVRVAESTSEHLPVILHAAGSIGSQDYSLLADSFIAHLQSLP